MTSSSRFFAVAVFVAVAGTAATGSRATAKQQETRKQQEQQQPGVAQAAPGRAAGMEGDGARAVFHWPVPPVVMSEAECPVRLIEAEAADGRPVRAWWRRPAGDRPVPAIVFIHGGLAEFPEAALRRHLTANPVITRFLAAGHAVVMTTFRTYEKDVQSRGPVEDVRAVVRATARLPGVDPRRIALYGGSGGGSIALELGGDAEVRAIVAGEPATVLYTGMLTTGDYGPRLEMMANPERFFTPELRKRTKAKLATLRAPVLILHGDKHDLRKLNGPIIVPLMQEAGVRVEYREYPGYGHGFYFGGGATGGARVPTSGSSRTWCGTCAASSTARCRPPSLRPPASRHARPAAVASAQTIADRFTQYDSNCDGNPTREEFPAAGIFDAAEADKDGVLTREEIAARFRKQRSGMTTTPPAPRSKPATPPAGRVENVESLDVPYATIAGLNRILSRSTSMRRRARAAHRGHPARFGGLAHHVAGWICYRVCSRVKHDPWHRRAPDQDVTREAFVSSAERHPGGIGITFPDHREQIAEDARRFRSLPPPERWRELFALRRWGSGLTVASSRGAAIRRLEADAESAWQAIQRELFARHGG